MKFSYYLITNGLILGLMVAGASISAQASTVTSVDCTAPKIIVTFASTIDTARAVSSSVGLYYIGFQNGKSASALSEINRDSGVWSSGNTVWTVYPTRDVYEATYSWNVWDLHIKTIADGTTFSAPCNG